MRLDIHEIINVPGASAPFNFEPDLSEAASGCVREIKQASAAGRVQNNAGVLVLSADVDVVLECTCARCLCEFERTIHHETETMLSESAESVAPEEPEENPDIYTFEGNSVDVGEFIATDFILSLDDRLLCSEDCKGLCENCGANLNDGPCTCKKETDPRLAALKQLLEEE